MDQNLWEQYQNLKKQRVSIIKSTQTQLRQLQKDNQKKMAQLIQISQAQPTSTIQILHNVLIDDIKITQQKKKHAKNSKEITQGNINKNENNKGKKIYFQNQQAHNQQNKYVQPYSNNTQSPRFNSKWGSFEDKQSKIAKNKVKSKQPEYQREKQVQNRSNLIDKFSKISPMLSPENQRVPISPKRNKKQYITEQHIPPTSQKINKNKY